MSGPAGGAVLLTGAAGRIGSQLRARLPEFGWQLRSTDREADPSAGIVAADVTSPDDLDAVVAGTQAIVHLAGVPTEAPWPVIREANIEATLQLFEAARRHGVRRVVYASSCHAAGFTPAAPDLPAETPPRPDTLYGVSKVFGEALGRYYADRYGLRVACLRIGTFAPRPRGVHGLATWLSPGDCARLVDACLRSADLGYSILWGVSANTGRTWSLAAGEALGYVPVDDSARLADPVSAGDPSDRFVGGGFTSAAFGIDEVASRA